MVIYTGYVCWIVFCGQSDTNTGQIKTLFGDTSQFGISWVNGRKIKITYPSIYHTTTITKLNVG